MRSSTRGEIRYERVARAAICSRRMLLEVVRRLTLDGHEVYLIDPESIIPDPDPGDGDRVTGIGDVEALSPARTVTQRSSRPGGEA